VYEGATGVPKRAPRTLSVPKPLELRSEIKNQKRGEWEAVDFSGKVKGLLSKSKKPTGRDRVP
jgi:hypothetical protein